MTVKNDHIKEASTPAVAQAATPSAPQQQLVAAPEKILFPTEAAHPLTPERVVEVVLPVQAPSIAGASAVEGGISSGGESTPSGALHPAVTSAARTAAAATMTCPIDTAQQQTVTGRRGPGISNPPPLNVGRQLPAIIPGKLASGAMLGLGQGKSQEQLVKVMNPQSAQAVSWVAASFFENAFMMPIGAGLHAVRQGHSDSFTSGMMHVAREQGAKGLWRNYAITSTTGAVILVAVQPAVRAAIDMVKERNPDMSKGQILSTGIVTAAVVGGAVLPVTYPLFLITVKRRDDVIARPSLRIVKDTIEKEGLMGMYKGVKMSVPRQIVGNGAGIAAQLLITMAFDQYTQTVAGKDSPSESSAAPKSAGKPTVTVLPADMPAEYSQFSEYAVLPPSADAADDTPVREKSSVTEIVDEPAEYSQFSEYALPPPSAPKAHVPPAVDASAPARAEAIRKEAMSAISPDTAWLGYEGGSSSAPAADAPSIWSRVKNLLSRGGSSSSARFESARPAPIATSDSSASETTGSSSPTRASSPVKAPDTAGPGAARSDATGPDTAEPGTASPVASSTPAESSSPSAEVQAAEAQAAYDEHFYNLY